MNCMGAWCQRACGWDVGYTYILMVVCSIGACLSQGSPYEIMFPRGSRTRNGPAQQNSSERWWGQDVPPSPGSTHCEHTPAPCPSPCLNNAVINEWWRWWKQEGTNPIQCRLCANLPCGTWSKFMKCVITVGERESWDYVPNGVSRVSS